MTYWSSPSEIAFIGHSPAQVPHFRQLSVILYAMGISSYYKEYPHFIMFLGKCNGEIRKGKLFSTGLNRAQAG